jgi:hypothetical protein
MIVNKGILTMIFEGIHEDNILAVSSVITKGHALSVEEHIMSILKMFISLSFCSVADVAHQMY